jgi:hypothetical protein
MANSIGQLSAQLLATETAQQIEDKFPVLSKFCVNYTENIPAAFGYGSTLVVKNLANPTVSKFVSGVGFQTATASASDITITVNQYASSKVGFDDTQLSSPVGGLFVEKFAERTSYSLSEQIVIDTIANVSSSNFSSTQSFASSSAFGRTAINNSMNILDNNSITDDGRIILVNPNYYAQGLLSDNTLTAPLNFQINSNVGPSGKFLEVLDFEIAKASKNVFPSTFDGTNNLVGFAAHPSALAFVTVTPPNPTEFVQSGATVMDFGMATSPRSGITVVVAKYYLPGASTLFIETKVMYGSTAGVPGALVAYTSPSTK